MHRSQNKHIHNNKQTYLVDEMVVQEVLDVSAAASGDGGGDDDGDWLVIE